MSRSKLLTRTAELIQDRPRTMTYRMLAEACGVTDRWLESIVAGTCKFPDVNKVEVVYEYLSGRTLDV